MLFGQNPTVRNAPIIFVVAKVVVEGTAMHFPINPLGRGEGATSVREQGTTSRLPSVAESGGRYDGAGGGREGGGRGMVFHVFSFIWCHQPSACSEAAMILDEENGHPNVGVSPPLGVLGKLRNFPNLDRVS